MCCFGFNHCDSSTQGGKEPRHGRDFGAYIEDSELPEVQTAEERPSPGVFPNLGPIGVNPQSMNARKAVNPSHKSTKPRGIQIVYGG